MPIPPRFETVEQASEFMLEHDALTAVLTPHQFGRLIGFIFTWADGESSLPLLVIEFYRTEIQRLDNIINT